MVKDGGCLLLWILLFCHRVSAEVLKENIYFDDGASGPLTVPAPPLVNGTEFSWEWTPHDSGQKKIQIATISILSSLEYSWTSRRYSGFSNGDSFGISMAKHFQNAGVFSFNRTKPALALLAQIEVFAVKISPFPQDPVGFDVCSRCEISRLPKSVKLQWEKEGDPTANTTLLFNNSAYIIVHSTNLQCNGDYICNVRGQNGELLLTTSRKLTVTGNTYEKHSTLYRGSSSEVDLTCQYYNAYNTAQWLWKQVPMMTRKTLASTVKGQTVQIARTTDRDRFSFSNFTGKHFPMRIAPLKFGDSGTYTCYIHNYLFSHVTLVVIQVSVEPPGGVSRYQPVVLTCEVSEVTEPVTLAWLRMEGGRGVQVKQIQGRGESVRNLSLTLPGLSGDQLHWECAVFRDDMLRARVPLHLTLLPGSNTPMIIALCVGVLCIGMLTSTLLFYCRRRTAADLATSPGTRNYSNVEFEVIYLNVTDLQKEEDNPNAADKAAESEVLYSTILLGASSTDQNKKCHPEPDHEGQTESVVYSSVNFT
ncbi:hypothetical protein SKAU_G00255900 [Synaphobranchus kaupii]|uniref:Ig-like domain-containing protein n=1 Tax=Synaphobranchus kaupii TaxID=118154 RepID=A0A9Q1F3R4_SYNKA|nr:hypothetical protein SKAU_G00255900 [Synaphobranchus kaupii]